MLFRCDVPANIYNCLMSTVTSFMLVHSNFPTRSVAGEQYDCAVRAAATTRSRRETGPVVRPPTRRRAVGQRGGAGRTADH